MRLLAHRLDRRRTRAEPGGDAARPRPGHVVRPCGRRGTRGRRQHHPAGRAGGVPRRRRQGDRLAQVASSGSTTSIRAAAQGAGRSAERARPSADDAARRPRTSAARRSGLFLSGRPIADTPVELYLGAAGSTCGRSAGCRARSPSTRGVERRGRAQAAVHARRDRRRRQGRHIATHRTWLAPDGKGGWTKADLEEPKMVWAASRAGFIPLWKGACRKTLEEIDAGTDVWVERRDRGRADRGDRQARAARRRRRHARQPRRAQAARPGRPAGDHRPARHQPQDAGGARARDRRAAGARPRGVADAAAGGRLQGRQRGPDGGADG
jgi:hypothetical protein